MSTWISVDTELPPEDEDVLGYIESGVITVLTRKSDGQWYYEDDDARVAKRVTHWMPLPEPPSTAGS